MSIHSILLRSIRPEEHRYGSALNGTVIRDAMGFKFAQVPGKRGVTSLRDAMPRLPVWLVG